MSNAGIITSRLNWKREFESIHTALGKRLTLEADLDRRMQVVVDVLWEHLHDQGVSWVGCYLKNPDQDEMILGPRRDKPACSQIGMQGVCGRAFLENKPLVVRDVRELGENYIACDPRDRSEVVIPIHDDAARPIGVLDVDSHEIGSFDESDLAGLQKILAVAGMYEVTGGQESKWGYDDRLVRSKSDMRKG